MILRIGAAGAIRWCAHSGRAAAQSPTPIGGNRHSARIEAQADLILALVAEAEDITLMELQAKLASQGHRFGIGIGTLWRFFDRHAITGKKDRACGRAGPSRHREATAGLVRCPA
jgi:hypothetical protein